MLTVKRLNGNRQTPKWPYHSAKRPIPSGEFCSCLFAFFLFDKIAFEITISTFLYNFRISTVMLALLCNVIHKEKLN